jgi:DNA invertase Pin-like site-specific DNA recombinase
MERQRGAGTAPPIRCAIYTRKSSEEGLDQEFNSLDAQREAGEAYIASQRNEGWVCLPDRYDDGGFSGGSMERPSLERLLRDIEAGRIDCVVVYKVDRLSRSLMDFARIMEAFDRKGVSFVSVTQQFNTTSSMGRLTLHILLSFAQFEREIIGERIRDKIAAQKRRGKWAGGVPVLGYEVDRSGGSPRLVVNPREAARVREIFQIYLDSGSLQRAVTELKRREWVNKRLVEGACAEIVDHTKDRSATLIFSSGIRHGQHIVDVLKTKHGVECGFVSGDTPDGVRSAILNRFRAGGLKYLCNVNVLTTGFDAPHIDCVALVRPTMSPGLYYQMVGRGFRLHPGKADCLVLDFGGNVLRHGPVDAIRISTDDRGDGEAPAKECPNCQALIAAGYQTCPQCGHQFPEPNKQQHEAKASTEGILSGQTTREEHRVSETTYHVHYKRGDPSAPLTMRVEYRIGFNRYFREWVCFDHTGYARTKAEAWWRARSVEPVPGGTEEAVEMAKAGALAPTLSITVEKKAGEQFERVTQHVLDDKPPRLDSEEGLPDRSPEPAGMTYGIPDDEIPF